MVFFAERKNVLAICRGSGIIVPMSDRGIHLGQFFFFDIHIRQTQCETERTIFL